MIRAFQINFIINCHTERFELIFLLLEKAQKTINLNLMRLESINKHSPCILSGVLSVKPTKVNLLFFDRIKRFYCIFNVIELLLSALDFKLMLIQCWCNWDREGINRTLKTLTNDCFNYILIEVIKNMIDIETCYVFSVLSTLNVYMDLLSYHVLNCHYW